MSETVIKIENLSKQYRLGLVGTGTLSHDLNRWWNLARGKEDPYLKVGEANDRSKKGNSEYAWALQDINLEVKQGEVIGIIGKNGAGKSTLLKILSRVTGPTTGSIKVKGRIGALLEVGTGFHPELTGRENIFLNGAILGMTKWEIKSRLDEIIDFSGTERYIDTPVKRYSSGMKVRLAFAVAAHLEPEILIVDEVLAVGDVDFQRKAIGKMESVSKTDGRTILFVSHNMAAVQKICNQAIILTDGMKEFEGDVSSALKIYLGKGKNDIGSWRQPKNDRIEITQLIINNDEYEVDFSKPIKIGFSVTFKVFEKMNIFFRLMNLKDEVIVTFNSSDKELYVEPQENIEYYIEAEIVNNCLLPGDYKLTISFNGINGIPVEVFHDIAMFQINYLNCPPRYIPLLDHKGKIMLDCKWIKK